MKIKIVAKIESMEILKETETEMVVDCPNELQDKMEDPDLPKKRRKRRKEKMVEGKKQRTKRLTPEDFQRIKDKIKAGYDPLKIAAEFGISNSYVWAIKSKMKKEGEL